MLDNHDAYFYLPLARHRLSAALPDATADPIALVDRARAMGFAFVARIAATDRPVASVVFRLFAVQGSGRADGCLGSVSDQNTDGAIAGDVAFATADDSECIVTRRLIVHARYCAPRCSKLLPSTCHARRWFLRRQFVDFLVIVHRISDHLAGNAAAEPRTFVCAVYSAITLGLVDQSGDGL